MKKRLFILTSFIMLFFMLSCQKDFDDYSQTNNVTLSDRLEVTNTNIPLVNKFGLKNQETNPEFIFTLVANVDAPTVNNSVLQATHVDINGDFAYVSYNMKGPETKGAVDIINISNPNNPVLVNTLEFPNKDINIVTLFNNKIFIGGQYSEGGFTGIVEGDEYGFVSDTFDPDSDHVTYDYEWNVYSINGFDHQDDVLYLSGGDNGGVYCWGGSCEYLIDDARSIRIKKDGSGDFFVSTGNGIYIWRQESGFSTVLSTNWIQDNSKADLDLTNKYLFSALNHGGAFILNLEDNTSQRILAPEAPEGYNSEDFVTNSVSYNDSLLFIANGGAGILVCGETDHFKSEPFYELGYFDFGGPLSSNFVTSKENFIFVAAGLGGLKILTFEESGLPDDFEPGVVCETLQESIIGMFPEQENAMNLHPYLFDGDNELRIITDSQTEVWVQFVWEGAGWKNTFGYYTYELGNEPTSVSDLNKNVIFPNVSGTNEGGGLNSGDMVFIGEFPANTVIGFYLVAQGWQNGEMVNGVYTHYTDINLNPNNTQQHLLFTENCCNELVLTFEDIRLPGGDKDFNDIILTIKDNNDGFENLPESFKTENVYYVPLCGGDFNPDNPCDNYQEETAYVGSDAGSNDGNPWWYYFDNTVKASHPIYAGQTLVEGAYAIYMDGVLTIELGDKMILQEGNETVKIQGYNEGDLPSFRPPAGLFTTYKGNDLVIDLPYYPYYIIHLDVEVCWD